jgi:hypothetical protein
MARLGMAPHFATLRRAIGYLSGVLLLYRGAKSFRPDSVVEAIGQWERTFRETGEGIRALVVPQQLSPSQNALLAATALANAAALGIRESLTAHGGGLNAAEDFLKILGQAHRLLMPIQDHRSGMMMVDFDHCCCHCAAAPAG